MVLESIWSKTAVLRAAARLESLSRVSLKESEAHGFAYLYKHKIALLESIWLKTAVLRATARLESLSWVSLRESEAAGFAKTTV